MRPRLPFSLPALALYALTLAAEVPVLFVRMIIALVVVVLALLITGHSLAHSEHFLELGMLPTLWAILALATPIGGGWWWRQNMGGRAASERERLVYNDALELLRGYASEPIHEPASWFVIDTPQPDAAVCGNTLMLSRGLLESDYLPAVLSHELGHLASPDGKLTAAINRLIIHPPPRADEHEPQEYGRRSDVALLAPDRVVLAIFGVRAIAWIIRSTVSFAKGGFGLRLTAPAWGVYWRQREYTADQYAASLGQAEELADFLEVHALIHDHPVPFIWLSEHTHPPVELRIDRLRAAAHAPPALVAPGSEPVKAAPAGPPSAGPDGPALTEPDPSAERSLRSAGLALPTISQTDHGKEA
ncbi:MAG: peptidase Ste24p, partial [Solirubrobacterales bacterium]|nr:peptidase Ste24p [Solirubrobacterales bacterium]